MATCNLRLFFFCAASFAVTLGSCASLLAAESEIRKGYADGRMGQVHYYTAGPEEGAEERTPLICIHHLPESGLYFTDFLKMAGRSRRVIAPDIPGYGNSDRPEAPPAVGDYAAAIGDALNGLGFGKNGSGPVDIMGVLTGSFIATELALVRPDLVRRLVLVSLPLLTTAEQEIWLQGLEQTKAWPRVSEDGSHLTMRWTSRVGNRAPEHTLEMYMDSFIDGLRSGDAFWWGEQAALTYPARDRLPQIKNRTLVIALNNIMKDAALRSLDVLDNASGLYLEDVGRAPFKTKPERLAPLILDFLDEPESTP